MPCMHPAQTLSPTSTPVAPPPPPQAILSSKDEYLINVLYSTLVAVRADADLLQYNGPGLGEPGHRDTPT